MRTTRPTPRTVPARPEYWPIFGSLVIVQKTTRIPETVSFLYRKNLRDASVFKEMLPKGIFITRVLAR